MTPPLAVSPAARENFFARVEHLAKGVRTSKGLKYAGAGCDPENYNTLAHFNKLAAKVNISPAKIAWLLMQKSLDGFTHQVNTIDKNPTNAAAFNELLEYCCDIMNYARYVVTLAAGTTQHAASVPSPTGVRPADEQSRFDFNADETLENMPLVQEAPQ